MDQPLNSAEPTGNLRGASGETADRIHKAFVESLRLPAGETDLPREQRLAEATGLDSIAVLEFVAAVENEFGITIEPEFLEFDFVTDLPRLVAYIQERTGRRPL